MTEPPSLSRDLRAATKSMRWDEVWKELEAISKTAVENECAIRGLLARVEALEEMARATVIDINERIAALEAEREPEPLPHLELD